MDLCSEGLNSICDSEDRSQPPGNFAQPESVGMDKGVSEGRKRTRVKLKEAGKVLLWLLQPYC